MVNLTQFERGGRTGVVEGATDGTTYGPYDCKGNNSIILHFQVNGTGQWDLTLKSLDVYGNQIAAKDINGNAIAFSNVSTSDSRAFKGIPSKFYLVTNEDSGTGNIDVTFELLTM